MSPFQDQRTSIPSLLLEQWRLGELPDHRKEALRQEFGDAFIAESLARLEAEESAYIPMRLPEAPVALPVKRPRRAWATATPWLAAAGLVLALFAGMQWQMPQPGQDTILLKGDAGPLIVYRQMEDTVVKVKDQDLLKKDDVIQFAYDAGSFTFGAIVSLDGRDHVTWLFPEKEQADGRLVHGQRTLLTSSYKLDDAPNFERFVLIRSKSPIDRLRLEGWLRSGAEQDKDPSWDVSRLTIRK